MFPPGCKVGKQQACRSFSRALDWNVSDDNKYPCMLLHKGDVVERELQQTYTILYSVPLRGGNQGYYLGGIGLPDQAVGSMVMGMRPEDVMDAELQPRNLASGAQWAFPPTLLMAARNDQDEIIDLVNRTAVHLESQVWHATLSPERLSFSLALK